MGSGDPPAVLRVCPNRLAAAAGAAEQPQAAPAGKPADDNVVDAEFKEVKDSK